MWQRRHALWRRSGNTFRPGVSARLEPSGDPGSEACSNRERGKRVMALVWTVGAEEPRTPVIEKAVLGRRGRIELTPFPSALATSTPAARLPELTSVVEYPPKKQVLCEQVHISLCTGGGQSRT